MFDYWPSTSEITRRSVSSDYNIWKFTDSSTLSVFGLCCRENTTLTIICHFAIIAWKKKNMIRILSILLISITNCLLVTAEQCKSDGSDDCHIFPWRSWESCNGACGHQNRRREQVFCCSANVYPHNIDNCLKHCNFSNNFERFQNKTCRVCEHGGTLLSVSSPCKCSLLYKGDCCQGRNNCTVSFISIFVWCFISNKNSFFFVWQSVIQQLGFCLTSIDLRRI